MVVPHYHAPFAAGSSAQPTQMQAPVFSTRQQPLPQPQIRTESSYTYMDLSTSPVMGPYSPRAMVQLLQQETSSPTPSDTQLTSGGGAGGALHTSHISIPSVSSVVANWSANEDLLNAITKAGDVAVVAEEGEVTQNTNT